MPVGYRQKGDDYKLKSKIVPDAKISISVERPGNKNGIGKKPLKLNKNG